MFKCNTVKNYTTEIKIAILVIFLFKIVLNIAVKGTLFLGLNIEIVIYQDEHFEIINKLDMVH